MQPHRRQPTRLPRPWDSPGKNTGVGCHFLLQCMKVKSESEVAQSCPTLRDPWTAAYQAPPPMGFSRQEYWSGEPLPSPEIEPRSLVLREWSLSHWTVREVHHVFIHSISYLYQCGSMAIYFVSGVKIHYCFILLFKLFELWSLEPLWPLEALSALAVGNSFLCPMTYPSFWVGFAFVFWALLTA